jgi:hypothetical protein
MQLGWHPVAAVQYTFGWHPVAAVQYTFTQKQYTEQHNEKEYTERNIHKNEYINTQYEYITIRTRELLN